MILGSEYWKLLMELCNHEGGEVGKKTKKKKKKKRISGYLLGEGEYIF